MIYISHRGNLNGPNLEKENHPDYIMDALNCGFDVEIDVWKSGKDFLLGHDFGQYKVDWKFLINQKFWCHAKNIEALHALITCGAHCFFHQEDYVTLTSKGILWTYPGSPLTNLSVCVMPEKNDFIQKYDKCYGVCSDFIMRCKNER